MKDLEILEHCVMLQAKGISRADRAGMCRARTLQETKWCLRSHVHTGRLSPWKHTHASHLRNTHMHMFLTPFCTVA